MGCIGRRVDPCDDSGASERLATHWNNTAQLLHEVRFSSELHLPGPVLVLLWHGPSSVHRIGLG